MVFNHVLEADIMNLRCFFHRSLFTFGGNSLFYVDDAA